MKSFHSIKGSLYWNMFFMVRKWNGYFKNCSLKGLTQNSPLWKFEFLVVWNIIFFKNDQNERKLSLQSCVTSRWPRASTPVPLRRLLSPKSLVVVAVFAVVGLLEEKMKATLPVMKVMRTKMRSGPCTACSSLVTTWCATLLKVVHWTSADSPATVSIFHMKEMMLWSIRQNNPWWQGDQNQFGVLVKEINTILQRCIKLITWQ